MKRNLIAIVLLCAIGLLPLSGQGRDVLSPLLTLQTLETRSVSSTGHTVHIGGAAVDIPRVISGRMDPYYLLIDEASTRGLGLGYRAAYSMTTSDAVLAFGASFSVIAAAVESYFPDFDPGFGGLLFETAYARPIIRNDRHTVLGGVTLGLQTGIPIDRASLSQIFDAYIAAAGFPDESFFAIAPFTATVSLVPELTWQPAVSVWDLGVSARPGLTTAEPYFLPAVSFFAERSFPLDTVFFSSVSVASRFDTPALGDLADLLAWPVGLSVIVDVATHASSAVFFGVSEGYPAAGASWLVRRTTIGFGFHARELSSSLWGYYYPVYYLEFLRR